MNILYTPKVLEVRITRAKKTTTTKAKSKRPRAFVYGSVVEYQPEMLKATS